MANGEDYNNILSADYWTPEAVARRANERRASSQQLAQQQNKSNAAPWEAIGGFLGETGNRIGKAARMEQGDGSTPWGAIGNFFNDANNNARDARREKLERQGNASPRMPQIRPELSRPNSSMSSNSRSTDDQRDRAMAGRQGMGPNSFGPAPRDPVDDILDRLGEKFSYDGANDRSMDSQNSALDELLKSRQGELDGLKTQSNDNWRESDGNVAAMHSAFQNDVRSQVPAIQERGQQAQENIGGIFNKTIDANKAGLESQNASKLEMLQRLGIAPAANQEDGFAEMTQQGTNAAQQGRDARQSEQAINTNTDLSRNTQLVNSIGNDGVARRSDLQGRLQEILGDISSKEGDLQTSYQESKMDLRNTGEDRAYDRWLADRQFDMGLFDSYNQQANEEAKLSIDAMKSQGQGMTGVTGLQANTSPKMRQAGIAVMANGVNVAKEPEKALRMLQDPKYGVSADEAFRWVTEYANLGSNNKFPAVQ